MSRAIVNCGPISRPDIVPEDYSQLFENYYSYVRALVYDSGIDFQNIDDVVMAILEKFIQHDALNDYDPEHMTHHGGIARKAVFRTFLSGFVRLYVRHHRDKQLQKLTREVLCPGSAEDEPTLEDYAPPIQPDYGTVFEADLVRSIREALIDHTEGRCALAPLFEEVLEHVNLLGKPDHRLLAQTFGVSASTVTNRMKDLRVIVGEVIGR